MLPYVRIEKDNLEINKFCKRARDLRRRLDDTDLPVVETLGMVEEMHNLDRLTESWREGSQWAYRTIHRSEIAGDETAAAADLPEFIQLHRDVWIAYEWNYHRTARIILHEQLLRCLDRLQELYPHTQEVVQSALASFKRSSVAIIRALVSDALSTVPQSLGDIDLEGHLMKHSSRTSICNGVGGYFLLWPIKVIKGTPSAT
jgi:hypothetical protein